MIRTFRVLCAFALSVVLTACWHSSGIKVHGLKLSGSVTGLNGTLVIHLNGGNDVTVSADTEFTFEPKFTTGDSYVVTVTYTPPPATPTQGCVVENGTGFFSVKDISSVAIVCTTLPLSIASSTPDQGSVGVARTAAPVLVFSVPLQASTVTTTNITLTSPAGAKAISLDVVDNQVTVHPVGSLLPNTLYTITVTTGVLGQYGESTPSSITRTFTVGEGAWGTPAVIETNAANDSLDAQIGYDSSGNAVAVWKESDGTRTNIWSNSFVAATGLWGTPVLIETDNAGPAEFPQIAVSAGGDAIAVWSQSDGTRFNIWSNRYTASTGLWGTAALIETDNAGSASLPQIVYIGTAGNALAVWQQSDGTRTNIWANRFTAPSTWATAALIETSNNGSATSPQLAALSNGNAVAVWQQVIDTAAPVYSKILANRFTGGTTNTWSTAVTISSTPAAPAPSGNAVLPQVAPDSATNAVAVWVQSDGTRNSTWASRFTTGGATPNAWSAAAKIETDDAGNTFDAQIGFDALNNAIAVWTQYDGERNNIYANRMAAAVWGATATLIGSTASPAGDATLPQVALDARGNAFALWAQFDGVRYNIWSNRYVIGTGWGTAALRETVDTGNANGVQVAVDANGGATAVWHQSAPTPSPHYDIWSSRFQ